MPHRPGPPFPAVIVLLLTLPVVAAAQLPADADWMPGYHHAGIQGTVAAMLSQPGSVVVGGSILAVGDVPVRNVARLETTAGVVTGWSALGAGLDGSVAALTVHEGQIIAGGMFNNSGATPVSRVARWDGSAWRPVGAGLPGVPVRALASYGGALYAGSYRWDGSAWTNFLQTDGQVWTLVVHDGLLFVGGDFEVAGADSVANVFAWDGQRVVALGAGLPEGVVDAVALPDAVVFATADPHGFGDVMRWDGAGWTTVRENGYQTSLGRYGSDLVVSRVTVLGWSMSLSWVGRLSGSAWSTVGGFTSRRMVEHEGRLLMEADEGVAPNLISPGLIAFDGARLQPAFAPGHGYDEGFTTLADLQGNVIAGGEFTFADGRSFDGAAITTGSDWGPWGARADLRSSGSFRDLAIVNGVTFGVFSYFDVDITVDILAKLTWQSDRGTWVELGSDLRIGDLQAVGSQLFSLDDQSVSLVDQATGLRTPVPGLDLDGYIIGSCEHQGDLVICGRITANAGVPCGRVLRRAGGAWQDLGAPASAVGVDQVVSLGGGRLAAAYSQSFGLPYRVSIHEGGRWTDLPGDFNRAITRLATHRGWLFAAGSFDRIGAATAHGIAMWTGADWAPLGSGLAGNNWGRVSDLISAGDDLWVCGGFTGAGGRPSIGLGRWTGDPSALAATSGVADGLPVAARRLRPAFPNPFNPGTSLAFTLPSAGPVSLGIFDARGARVRRLVDGPCEVGVHHVSWDGLDHAGRALPSGLYFARLTAAGVTEATKLMLVR